MTSEFNPYQTPTTSSEKIVAEVHQGKIEGDEPFVADDGFYCKADYQSPCICFLSGITLPEKTSPTMLSTKLTNKVHIYFDPQLIRGTSWATGITTMLFFILITIVCAVVFAVAILVGLILVFFVIPKPKSQITVNDASNSFIRITGGHENFLKRFPKRDHSTNKIISEPSE